MAEDGLRLCRGVRDDCCRTDPFVVETEVFGKTAADEQLFALFAEFVKTLSVFLQASAEALVGEIDERNDFPLGQSFGEPRPLFDVRVDPGWVVAAPVEQYCVACGDRLNRLYERVKVESVRTRVEVRVRFRWNGGRTKNLRVVGPGRIAQPDRGLWMEAMEVMVVLLYLDPRLT